MTPSLVFRTEEPLRRDEPIFSLQEVVKLTPDYKARHRYELITVVRADKLVEYEIDLGPASQFHPKLWNFMSGTMDSRGRIQIYHTVGEIRDGLEEMRAEGHTPYEDVYPEEPVTDWLQAYDDERDRRERETVKRSVFGPKTKIQRG